MNPIKSMLKKFARNKGYCFIKQDKTYFLVPLLYQYLKEHKKLYLIQIGANDGVRSDPLYEFVKANKDKVSGLVLEPLRDYFKQLKNNYADCVNIVPVNMAIHNQDKEAIIYRVDPSKMKGLNDFVEGMGSFFKDHHKGSSIPSELIIHEKVECLTLYELIEMYNVDEVDLLQIDAEGYDVEIIMAIDFDIIKPKIIRFEYGLYGNKINKNTLKAVADHLHQGGYNLVLETHDITAYRIESFLF